MNQYRKAIVAFLAGLSTWGVTAALDGSVDLVEGFGLVGVVATALGVAWAANADAHVEGDGDGGASAVEVAVIVIALVLFFAFFTVKPR